MASPRDKKLIVGNWKLNLDVQETSLYLYKLAEKVNVRRSVEVVLAPTMLTLQTLNLQIDRRQFKLAAQNFYYRDSGAFTGEVSARQLRGIVQYALVGHSERRHIFHETDRDVRHKVQAALRNNITPIVCIGETVAERANNETNDAIHDQLVGALTNVTSEEFEKIVIAYEPVWAIGTGDNALPTDVIAAEKTIRNQIDHLYGRKAAQNVRLLYGGSVNKDNAADYLAIPGIDGLLMGGASLDASAFSEITEKAYEQASRLDKR